MVVEASITGCPFPRRYIKRRANGGGAEGPAPSGGILEPAPDHPGEAAGLPHGGSFVNGGHETKNARRAIFFFRPARKSPFPPIRRRRRWIG